MQILYFLCVYPSQGERERASERVRASPVGPVGGEEEEKKTGVRPIIYSICIQRRTRNFLIQRPGDLRDVTFHLHDPEPSRMVMCSAVISPSFFFH